MRVFYEFLELLLVVVPAAIAFGLIVGAVRLRNNARRKSYKFALTAWIPMWFGGVLWHFIIDPHRAMGYPWWFWVLWLVALTCFALRRRSFIAFTLLEPVLVIGFVLVITAFVTSLYGWRYVPQFLVVSHHAGAVRLLVWLALVLAIITFVLVLIGKAARFVVIALVLVLFAALGFNLIPDGGGHKPTAKPGAITSAPSSTPVSPMPAATVTVTQSAVPASVNANSVGNQVSAMLKGYTAGQVVVGTQNIDWKNHQATHGVNDFTTNNTVLMSQSDVAKFLNGFSAQSKAAKATVITAIKKAGYGQSEINRALNGTGYLPLQVKVASQFLGTTYFQGGKVLTVNGWRAINANDVFWVFITANSHVIRDATLRADCGNAHLEQLRPVTPTTPPAPPATCASCQPVEQCVASGTSGPGYKLVGCTWIKVSCTQFGMQTCGGPNHQYQPVQSNAPALLAQPSTVPKTTTPLQPGPGGTQAPPSSAAPNGYIPSGSAAPGGGTGNGGSTSVGMPKPNPTPSCDPANGCGAPQTSSAPQPK